ncbi:hypothetical protein HD806DRAFT_524710 [Xylariaceae sp. AK1471]|nr:hypothetical protein HD806DRAFT_524710 [Xylariaceae sp. AK1471]
MTSPIRRSTRVRSGRPTRSRRRAPLSNAFDTIIKRAKASALREKRASDKQKYAEINHLVFYKFMQLPLELREKIYFFAMEEPGSPRDLRLLRSPPLASVNKQVREESLYVFLTQCVFCITLDKVISPPDAVYIKREGYKSLNMLVEKIPLSRWTAAGSESFFPNIEISIPDPCRHTWSIHLRAQKGRLIIDYDISCKTGRAVRRHKGPDKGLRKWIRHAVDTMQGLSRERTRFITNLLKEVFNPDGSSHYVVADYPPNDYFRGFRLDELDGVTRALHMYGGLDPVCLPMFNQDITRWSPINYYYHPSIREEDLNSSQ